MGASAEEVLEALESSEAYNFVSLESDRNSDSQDSTFSILEYVGKNDHLIDVVEDRATLAEGLKQLSPLEQQVLYLRFFEDIASRLGVSQMQVSRMLRKTLRVLREALVPEEV